MIGKQNKRFSLALLVVVNALAICLDLLKPDVANVLMNGFAYANNLPGANFNTSYVTVQGMISNLGPRAGFNVTLVVGTYVDYQIALSVYTPIGRGLPII